jgi:hypothetical protein
MSDALALETLGGERETDYGRIRLWASAGWAVATIAFGAWFERNGLGSMLPLYGVSTVAFAAVAARFPQVTPIEPVAIGSRLGAVGAVFRTSQRFALFLAGASLAAVATRAAWTFVPLVIADAGWRPVPPSVSSAGAAICAAVGAVIVWIALELPGTGGALRRSTLQDAFASTPSAHRRLRSGPAGHRV